MQRQFRRITGIFSILFVAAAVTAGTWSPNKFTYEPSLGARGTAEKDIFTTGLQRVDAHLGKYKTLGDPNYTTLTEALTTIGSSEVTLTIPAGTQPGQTFRLAGRGMPHLRSPQTHGDLFARARVSLPRSLTPEQRVLFEKLAGSR
jgi:hypothetical protein